MIFFNNKLPVTYCGFKRCYLQICLVNLLLLFTLECPAQSVTLPNGIAAGDASTNSVVLWTKSTMMGLVEFKYWRQTSNSAKAQRISAQSDGITPVKVTIQNLLPGTKYYYQVTDHGHSTIKGQFKTPHQEIKHYGLRFGVSGDSRGDNLPFYSMKNIPKRQLDFVVNLGDTIYADVKSPGLPGINQARTLPEFHAKHAEIYNKTSITTARASTLFYVAIDDHEIMNDFAGGASVESDARFASDEQVRLINETSLYRNGLQAFMDYNPIQQSVYPIIGDPLTDARPKIYRYQLFGKDAAIFITDSRSFRDQEIAAPILGNEADITRFRQQTFKADRSLLGHRQLNQLLADLSNAEEKQITWKFVLLPEPIQNLSYIAANDRYEGYAAERTELLKKIEEKGIHNVVFVAADIHGTLINNLTYQETFNSPQIFTDFFEVTTGAWAYRDPLAPTVAKLMYDAGFLSAFQYKLYQSLSNGLKETFVHRLLDNQLIHEGFDPIGLQNTTIDAKLKQGGYTATHSFGWSEFDINAKTQQLQITTFGVYPESHSAPKIFSQLIVRPFKP